MSEVKETAQETMSEDKGFWFVLADLVETIIVAVGIFTVVYIFLVQPHQVKGISMLPNFRDSEYILTDKISYRFSPPQRGDVIIFKAPKNYSEDYIKRIIALPGEKIKLDNGELFVYNKQHPDGVQLKEPYEITAPTSPGPFLKDGNIVQVPDNQYFVMGDNRIRSFDSREWGMVPKENIIGRAWLRYWPLTRAGFIPQPNYGI